MQDLKITIITCSLNSESFIEETIQSVLMQDYPNIEYIIIDGGSSDNTLNIISKYESKIRCISEKDKGISDAMNKGIKFASGDIIAHLHADDFYLNKTVVGKVAKIFLDNNVYWVVGKIKNLIDGKICSPTHKTPKYSYEKLLSRNRIPHPATFIRKTVFDEVGLFNTSLEYAMDYDMWLRIGKKYNLTQVDEYFTVFRRHNLSISTKSKLKTFEEDYLVRKRYIDKSLIVEMNHFLRYFFRKFKLYFGIFTK